MPKSNKTEQSIYECLLGFCFNISAPPQILAASTVFPCPIPETKKMMGDGFLWCYCCRFVLNSKRLLSTSCNKQGQRSKASSIFSIGVIPDAFEVRRIVCRKLNKP